MVDEDALLPALDEREDLVADGAERGLGPRVGLPVGERCPLGHRRVGVRHDVGAEAVGRVGAHLVHQGVHVAERVGLVEDRRAGLVHLPPEHHDHEAAGRP